MRDAKLILLVGTNGYGKSTFVEERLEKSERPNALIYVEEEDIFNGAYQKFPLRKFYGYGGGKVRINAARIAYDEFLDNVIGNFSNGVLVIDEGGVHESGVLSKPMKRLMAVRRKKGIDIILCYHGLSDLPVRQFQFVNWVVLFHTCDEFAAKSNVPKRKEFIEARERIEQQVKAGNLYHKEFIWFS